MSRIELHCLQKTPDCSAHRLAESHLGWRVFSERAPAHTPGLNLQGPFMLLGSTQSICFGVQKRIQGLLYRTADKFSELILDVFFIDLDYLFHGLLFL
jgi:hypothetical protein